MKTPARRLNGSACLVLAATILVVGAGSVMGQDNLQRYHHAKTSPKVDYRGFFDAAEPLSESADGQAVLDKCFAAHGGRETLAALEGLRLTYAVPGDRADGGTVVKSFARGRRYRVDSGDSARMIDGRRCWVANGVFDKEMTDFRYRAELFSYLVLTMPLAAERESFTDVRFGGGSDPDLDYFYFDKADSLLVVVGVDREKGLIRTAAGILPDDEMDIVYVNEFEDYRAAAGIVLAHKVTHISMGMNLGHILLEKAEPNPDFDTNTFRAGEDDL